ATQVVSCGADKELEVWDIKTREKIISLGNHSAAVTAVAWPDEGNVIIAGTDSGDVYSYSNLKPHTGEQSSRGGDEKKIGNANEAVLCAAATRDAKTIFAGSHDGVVHVWNSERKLLAKLTLTTVPGAPVTPAGRHQVVAGAPRVGLSNPKSEIRNPSSRRLPPIGSVVSLTAEPDEISLTADAPRHGVLISAHTADGFDVDVTDCVRFSTNRRMPFEVNEHGEVHALRPGEGALIVSFGRRRVEIPVKIEQQEDAIDSDVRSEPLTGPSAFAKPTA